ERETLEIHRAHDSFVVLRDIGTQHLDGEHGGRVVGRGESVDRPQPAGDDGDRALVAEPRPRRIAFPPTRLLFDIAPKEETPARTPWWLTLLRLTLAAQPPQHRQAEQAEEHERLGE